MTKRTKIQGVPGLVLTAFTFVVSAVSCGCGVVGGEDALSLLEAFASYAEQNSVLYDYSPSPAVSSYSGRTTSSGRGSRGANPTIPSGNYVGVPPGTSPPSSRSGSNVSPSESSSSTNSSSPGTSTDGPDTGSSPTTGGKNSYDNESTAYVEGRVLSTAGTPLAGLAVTFFNGATHD